MLESLFDTLAAYHTIAILDTRQFVAGGDALRKHGLGAVNRKAHYGLLLAGRHRLKPDLDVREAANTIASNCL